MSDNRRGWKRDKSESFGMTVTPSLPQIGAVLLLEDDALISLDTEEILLSLGADRVHVAHSLDAAESIVAAERLDVAVLDLVIGSGRSEALARRLVGQSLPVVFASGHDDVGEIAIGLERVPMVRKPYSAQSLQAALAAALGARGPDGVVQHKVLRDVPARPGEPAATVDRWSRV